MKQTAVEYLIDGLRDSITEVVSDTKLHFLIETALEIEKEQIIDAFNSYPIVVMDAEQYYNENFKSEYNEKTKI